MAKGDEYICEVCDHVWKTRKAEGSPPRCPRCNSRHISFKRHAFGNRFPGNILAGIGGFLSFLILLGLVAFAILLLYSIFIIGLSLL